MNFINLPEPDELPEWRFDWFSFHATGASIEELARQSLSDYLAGEDANIVQAIWTTDWTSINTRSIEPSFAITARFSHGKTPILEGFFLLPRTGRPLSMEEVSKCLNEMEALANTSFELRSHINTLLAPWRKPARGNHQRRPDSAYAALALRYSQLVSANDKNPRQTLSKELGLSLPSISARVREARVLGFLGETNRGKADGDLMPTARSLIETEIIKLYSERF